eukprot:TRINITY_DN89763_c0_g1_i1.p1 TRINITY_DN89763_c0_g1~~TRINITY_DN89763_c0_g1_i1.p1  ORF type:complete len:603 (+),score=14.39 TRINITY_DN89763_c0_g1_i1:205-2013(+)
MLQYFYFKYSAIKKHIRKYQVALCHKQYKYCCIKKIQKMGAAIPSECMIGGLGAPSFEAKEESKESLSSQFPTIPIFLLHEGDEKSISSMTKSIHKAFPYIDIISYQKWGWLYKRIEDYKNDKVILITSRPVKSEEIYQISKSKIIKAWIICSEDKKEYLELASNCIKVFAVTGTSKELTEALEKCINCPFSDYSRPLTFYIYKEELHKPIFKEFLKSLVTHRRKIDYKKIIKAVTTIYKDEEIQQVFDIIKRAIESQDKYSLLRLYTGDSFYVLINHLLCELEPTTMENVAELVICMIAQMRLYMDRHPDKVPCAGSVHYRGLQLTKSDSAKYKIGTKIVFLAFMSTSNDLNIAREFSRGNKEENLSRVIMKIKYVPQLADYLKPIFISEISEYKNETEVLYPLYSKFIVLSNKKKSDETIIELGYLGCVLQREIIEYGISPVTGTFTQEEEKKHVGGTIPLQANSKLSCLACKNFCVSFYQSPYASFKCKVCGKLDNIGCKCTFCGLNICQECINRHLWKIFQLTQIKLLFEFIASRLHLIVAWNSARKILHISACSDIMRSSAYIYLSVLVQLHQQRLLLQGFITIISYNALISCQLGS